MKTFLISFDFKDLLRTCSKRKRKPLFIGLQLNAQHPQVNPFLCRPAPPQSTTYAFSLYALFPFFLFYDYPLFFFLVFLLNFLFFFTVQEQLCNFHKEMWWTFFLVLMTTTTTTFQFPHCGDGDQSVSFLCNQIGRAHV